MKKELDSLLAKGTIVVLFILCTLCVNAFDNTLYANRFIEKKHKHKKKSKKSLIKKNKALLQCEMEKNEELKNLYTDLKFQYDSNITGMLYDIKNLKGLISELNIRLHVMETLVNEFRVELESEEQELQKELSEKKHTCFPFGL